MSEFLALIENNPFLSTAFVALGVSVRPIWNRLIAMLLRRIDMQWASDDDGDSDAQVAQDTDGARTRSALMSMLPRSVVETHVKRQRGE